MIVWWEWDHQAQWEKIQKSAIWKSLKSTFFEIFSNEATPNKLKKEIFFPKKLNVDF